MTKDYRWIKLENLFHHTSCRVRAEEIQGGVLVINKSQANRASRKLCGMSDCQCAQDDLSQYGATEYVGRVIPITTRFGAGRREWAVELIPSHLTY
jgi:hypothetical protein